MTENITSTEVSVNRFVKCPHPLLFDKSLIGAALKLWLVIEHHRFGDKSYCFPSQARLSELTGYSKRYIRDLTTELESKKYLSIERASGKVSRYTPRNYNVTVHPDPGTIPSHTGELYRHTPRNHNVTEEDVLKQNNIIREQPLLSGAKNKSPKTAPKDVDTLKTLLGQVEIEAFRIKYPGLEIDSLWGDFQEKTLYGTPKKPEPNPYEYKDFNLAFNQWCRAASKNGDHKKPVSSGLPDLKGYQF